MKNLLELLQEIGLIIEALWNIPNMNVRPYWRKAIWVLVLVPIGLTLLATVIPAPVKWLVIPVLTLVPLGFVVYVALRWDPLLFLAISIFPLSRRIVAGLITAELLFGIYLTFVPVGEKPWLVPALFLVGTTLTLMWFSGAMTRGWKITLVTIIFLLTLAFLRPATSSAIREWWISFDKLDAQRVRQEGPLGILPSAPPAAGGYLPSPQPARAIAKQPVEVRIVLRGETIPSEPFDLNQYLGGWICSFENAPDTTEVHFRDGTKAPISVYSGVKGGKITFTGPVEKTVTIRCTPPSS